jgi:nucleotide-binding universal stress UspA family protein
MPNRLMWEHTSRADASHLLERDGSVVDVGTNPESAPNLPMLRTVLVPLDGTRTAEHALPYALAIARRAGAEVMLVHVYSTLQAANEPELLGWHANEYRVEPGRDYLETVARRLADVSPVKVRTLLRHGYFVEDTLCETGDWAADLVVMAARRRGWWSRLWSGSVSNEVARRSRRPVLLVPGHDISPDLTHEPPLGRVLVPLDGTVRAERALGPAAALAALAGGECELLHVDRPRPSVVDWLVASHDRSTSAQATRTQEAYRYLHGVAERLRGLAVPASTAVVTDAHHTADAIARCASLSGADVIAMTSRSAVGWTEFFRGNLAVQVAREASRPVLVCRAP